MAIPPEAPLELAALPSPFFQNFLLAWMVSDSSIFVSWISRISREFILTRSLIASSLDSLPIPMQFQETNCIRVRRRGGVAPFGALPFFEDLVSIMSGMVCWIPAVTSLYDFSSLYFQSGFLPLGVLSGVPTELLVSVAPPVRFRSSFRAYSDIFFIRFQSFFCYRVILVLGCIF